MEKSNEDVAISPYLNTSRKDKNGEYKVRLYVYFKPEKKHKYYSTKFSFTQKDFKSTWETVKPRKEFKTTRKELQALITKADQVAASLDSFNFEDFERLMFNKVTTDKNVNYYYSKKIEDCHKQERIGTSKGYDTALKCFLRFHDKETIALKDITVSWLESFEKFCIEQEEKSKTTVGIYLRTLRTVLNDAIEDKTISQDVYPFGKKKYRIPAPKKTKKALTPEQLKKLFESEPKTPQQEKAKAFWFFSYLCNGMNLKDILHLRCKNVDNEKIQFIRAKTERSTSEQKPITVYFNDYTAEVLNTYGNPKGNPNDYIFPILDRSANAERQHLQKQSFTRYINQHFLKYAKANGINEKISTYWARHSFTTMAINKGASMELVSEAVGHTDTKTTQAYFAGFEDKTKKDLSKNLLDF